VREIRSLGSVEGVRATEIPTPTLAVVVVVSNDEIVEAARPNDICPRRL